MNLFGPEEVKHADVMRILGWLLIIFSLTEVS